jgi:hypothetical protein
MVALPALLTESKVTDTNEVKKRLASFMVANQV